MSWTRVDLAIALAVGVLIGRLVWLWLREAAELRAAWRSEQGWRGPAKERVMREQIQQEIEPEVHTFVVVFSDGRKRSRPRSYKGTFEEAKAAAARWVEEDETIAQVVTEDGELVAERFEVRPFRSGA